MENNHSFDWDAASYFKRLCETNKQAIANGFDFTVVSSLDGFYDALSDRLSSSAIVAVSDTSDGAVSVAGVPVTRRVKTVFMAMRHAVGSGREECLVIMRELFRQFMSALILERTRLQEGSIYIDDRISFHEIDQYFATGCACAYFQISVDSFTDLAYNQDEWL